MQQIASTLGCCRFVFNYYLDMRQKQYKNGQPVFNYNACAVDMTQLKKQKEWLKDVDSTALQSSVRDLDEG